MAYNVSGAQQGDRLSINTYIILRLFFIIGYYKILAIVPYANTVKLQTVLSNKISYNAEIFFNYDVVIYIFTPTPKYKYFHHANPNGRFLIIYRRKILSPYPIITTKFNT